ncbi:COP8 protein [Mycena sanguinolenta]|uniref:COP8 protein n=1 Tax=Mycena sanguinolenta TaxID=230812 RepID=A0A8H6YZD3_9AGAR|nr:COP8 protein [Mycena sanguinolenta]
MFASFAIAAVLFGIASAKHTITLRNNCASSVGLTISNYPNSGPPYTGNTAPNIAAGKSRICDRPPKSGCQNNCFGGIAFGKAPCSMTEWTFDSANIGGKTDYDISNIQGFSVAQKIIPGGSGATVTCKSAKCPCNEAYRPGDTSGTCGGTGPVDQATRVGASSDYTVV